MSTIIKLKQGLDINLVGEAQKAVTKTVAANEVSLKPSDFACFKPHLEVRVGDKVKAGSVLFTDKNRPEIRFCSPVSGEVTEVRRAERRRITDVVVKADGNNEYEKFDTSNLSSKEAVKNLLLQSGVWPYLRQRPFNIIADPKQDAKAVYISTFDSAPLAADYQFVLKDQLADFQAGVDLLSKIAPVYVGYNAKISGNVFANVKNAKITGFEGPHPAGNAGVQISHVCPVNKGEMVIVVNPQDVVIVGRLAKNGIYDAKKTIALAGGKVKNPAYFSTVANAKIDGIISGNYDTEDARIIGGNVLTGTKLSADGYLGFYDNEISIIPEGNYYVWVRVLCPKGDTSAWEGPLAVKPTSWNMRANHNDTLTLCGVSIYDDGGPNGDLSNQTSTLVILPDMAGHLVSLSGRSHCGGSSVVTIYDGIGNAVFG